MMVREDGAEKTKQLFVGAIVLCVGFWLLWQYWFGIGFFEGHALVNGEYGSAATDIFQMVVGLIGFVGSLSLGMFRTGMDILKWLGGFFFGAKDEVQSTNQKLTIDVVSKVDQSGVVQKQSSLQPVKVVDVLDSPVFTVGPNGELYRNLSLEKQLAGPKTTQELAEDALDAFLSGDSARLNERFSQLHPEVKKDEPAKQA